MSEFKQPDAPNHVGIILDGNRRWAKARGMEPTAGHEHGYRNLREICRHIFAEHKVPYVSAFVFSTENWQRTEKEVGFLMGLVSRALNEYLSEFIKENVRILVLGSRERLSDDVLKAIEKAEQTTKNNTKGTLILCFNYGGQQEIVDAAKSLIENGADPTSVSVESFAKSLYHPEVPPLDLVIRTSGEQRLSGFMLWRAAYAEFYFVNKHWPEFTSADLDDAFENFAKRQRRYGK